MSRRSSRRSGRPYQPYPARRTNWAARVVVVVVIVFLLVGAVAVALTR